MGLKVSNISKEFSGNQIITDFNLEINTGEVTIIVGESGSGKTTFLRLLNNLESVDAGTIQIEDNYLVQNGEYKSENDIKKYQQKIGLVFQDYQLFPNLDVMDNLLLAPLSNHFDTKESLTKKARTLLQKMEVKDKESVKPSKLSGGQKQRVAIARAMMMNPSILCFDEPTSALDEKSVERVAQLIQSLAKEGMMILIITHDLELVKLMGEEARVIQSTEFK